MNCPHVARLSQSTFSIGDQKRENGNLPNMQQPKKLERCVKEKPMQEQPNSISVKTAVASSPNKKYSCILDFTRTTPLFLEICWYN